MRLRPWMTAIIAGLFLLGASGCALGPRLYVNPQAELGTYKKLGLLPFRNLTIERFAGDRVLIALETELISTGRFKVVGPADLSRALRAAGVDPGDPTGNLPKLKIVCDTLGVSGLVRGTVTEYANVRLDEQQIPVVSFDCEMIDAPTGTIVWRTSVSLKGKGRVAGIVGVGSRTMSALTEAACARVVGKLSGKAV